MLFLISNWTRTWKNGITLLQAQGFVPMHPFPGPALGGGFAKLTLPLNRPKTWSTVPCSLLLASSSSTHSFRFCLAFLLASQKYLFVETDLHWIFCIFSMEFYTFHDLRVWGSLNFAPWKLWNIHLSTFKLQLFLKPFSQP